MAIAITAKTDRFNLSVVGADFINDCCFGEDIATWLIAELRAKNFTSSTHCMEDFGWYHDLSDDVRNYDVFIGGNSDELPDNPNYGTWQIIVERKRGLLSKLLGRDRIVQDERVIAAILETLRSNRFSEIETEEVMK